MLRFEIIAVILRLVRPFTTTEQREELVTMATKSLKFEYNIAPKQARKIICLALTQHLTNKPNDSDKN